MSLQAADIFDAWWVILFSIMVLPLIAIYIFHVRIRRQYLLKHEEKAGYWKASLGSKAAQNGEGRSAGQAIGTPETSAG